MRAFGKPIVGILEKAVIGIQAAEVCRRFVQKQASLVHLAEHFRLYPTEL